jgi:hypothetical protein
MSNLLLFDESGKPAEKGAEEPPKVDKRFAFPLERNPLCTSGWDLLKDLKEEQRAITPAGALGVFRCLPGLMFGLGAGTLMTRDWSPQGAALGVTNGADVHLVCHDGQLVQAEYRPVLMADAPGTWLLSGRLPVERLPIGNELGFLPYSGITHVVIGSGIDGMIQAMLWAPRVVKELGGVPVIGVHGTMVGALSGVSWPKGCKFVVLKSRGNELLAELVGQELKVEVEVR